MQIQFLQNNIVFNNSSIPQRRVKSPLAPLSCDTVSFGAIKKTSLDGFSLACANKFKAPLEKFNSKEDFNLWAKGELEKSFSFHKYQGPNKAVSRERSRILQEWKDYLQEDNNIYIKNPALSLIIFSAIVKNLDKNNANLPPLLNKRVLSDTTGQIEDGLKKDNKYQFDFNKIYQNNLRMYFTQGVEETQYQNGSTIEGWISIPSKINDPDNFDKNVDKLKTLSHNNWCTKSTHAELYLKDGDFHIYYENGKPKLGIRFIWNKIGEIQGEANNGKIPLTYFDVAKEYVNKNKFKGAEKLIKQARIGKQNFDKAKLNLEESIENKDYKKILEYFGFKVKVLEDNTLEISEYKQPDESFTFKDLGIDEKDLFKNVSRIKGDAVFNSSNIKDFINLISIGGTADFSNSQIQELGNLKEIGGGAYFGNSKITTLGNLQSIDGYAYFCNSQVQDLGSLQTIGSDAYFRDSQIKDLGNLQLIGGDANFSYSQIRDLGSLQRIGEAANFSNSQIKHLGNLQSIGRNADFKDSQVKDLGNLQSIGGYAWFSNSQIKNLGNLQVIEEAADFRDSEVQDLGSLRSIGGSTYLKDSNITTLRNLQSIGGIVSFRDSKIKDLGALKSIGFNADFRFSQISNLGNLQSIGGDADFRCSQIENWSKINIKGKIYR